MLGVEFLCIFMLLEKRILDFFFSISLLGYFVLSATALSGLGTIVNQFSENVLVIV